MIITVDGRRVEANRGGGDTLQEVLDDVRSAHLGERLIISVSVNGETLDEGDLQADLEQPVDSIQIEHAQVQEAKAGDAIGIKVSDRCRGGDLVYKVT